MTHPNDQITRTISFRDRGTLIGGGHWDPGFDCYGVGFDQRFKIVNNLGTLLYVFDRAGKLLQTVPTETYKDTGTTIIPGKQVTIQRAVSPANECSIVSIEASEVMFEPIGISELGIILAVEQTRQYVKSFEDCLTDIMLGKWSLKNDRGGKLEFPAMVVFGNFDTEKFPKMYLGINDVIMAVTVKYSDGFEPGRGVIYVEQQLPDGPVRTPIHIDLKTLAEDEDGVITVGKARCVNNSSDNAANYFLGVDYSLVKLYREKCLDGIIAERKALAGASEPVVKTIDEALIEQRILAHTENMRIQLRKAEDERDMLRSDIDTFLKTAGVNRKTNKTLKELLQESINPEFQEDHLERQKLAQEQHLEEKALINQKTKAETVKSGIGIATGLVGLIALISSPVKTLWSWITKAFTGVAAVAA